MKALNFFYLLKKLVSDKISVYFAWVGVGMILSGGLYTVVSVSLRYTIGKPVRGDIEVPALMLPAAVALFYILTNAQRKHIRTTVLVRHFPVPYQTLAEGVSFFIGSFLTAIVAWQIMLHALDFWERGIVTIVLRVPEAPFEFFFVFAMILFSLHLLLEGTNLVKMFIEQR